MTEDGSVAHLELEDVLQSIVLDAIKRSDVPKSIKVKLAFNGAQQTNNHKNLQVGTCSAPLGRSVAEAMTPENAYVIFTMASEEEENKYRAGLVGLADKVQQLLDKGAEVDIGDGKSVHVNARVVLDLKSLCMFLGLCSIYNINCEYGCPYCHVRRADLAKQEPSTMRTTKEVHDYSKKAAAAGKLLTPKTNLGYSHQGLLVLPDSDGRILIDVFSPDLLHIILNCPRKILASTLQYVAATETDIINEIVAFLKGYCKVYVPTSVKEGKTEKKDLLCRVEKAIWRRDNCLCLLTNVEVLVDIMGRTEQF